MLLVDILSQKLSFMFNNRHSVLGAVETKSKYSIFHGCIDILNLDFIGYSINQNLVSEGDRGGDQRDQLSPLGTRENVETNPQSIILANTPL